MPSFASRRAIAFATTLGLVCFATSPSQAQSICLTTTRVDDTPTEACDPRQPWGSSVTLERVS